MKLTLRRNGQGEKYLSAQGQRLSGAKKATVSIEGIYSGQQSNIHKQKNTSIKKRGCTSMTKQTAGVNKTRTIKSRIHQK